MRTAILLVSCLALAATGCSPGGVGERRMLANGQPIEAPGLDAYGEGKQHLLTGNYGLAVGQLRAALRSSPDSPEILNALAVAYEQLGRRDIAQAYFAQALATDPASVQTLNNVARSLMRSGSIALAGSYLQRAAALDPQNAIVRSNLQFIARSPPANPAGRAAHEVVRGIDRSAWIERAGPQLQTLVTKPAMRAEHASMDDAMLPLVSFASVSFAPETAAAEMPANRSWPFNERAEEVLVSYRAVAAALAIANGNGRTGMAARLRAYLEDKGWKTTRLLNANHFGYARTTITYRTGFASEAQDLAAALPVAVDFAESAVLDTDVLLRIGKDILAFDQHTKR